MSTASSIGEVFGYYYNENNLTQHKRPKSGIWSICTILNVLNVAGYFPGLGIITMVVRSILAYNNFDLAFNYANFDKNNASFKAYKYAFIARGVVEGAGAGILFLAMDVAMTLKRLTQAPVA